MAPLNVIATLSRPFFSIERRAAIPRIAAEDIVGSYQRVCPIGFAPSKTTNSTIVEAPKYQAP